MTASASWPRLLDLLLQGIDLEAEQATALMRGWLEGVIEPVLTGALLAALRARSEEHTSELQSPCNLV